MSSRQRPRSSRGRDAGPGGPGVRLRRATAILPGPTESDPSAVRVLRCSRWNSRPPASLGPRAGGRRGMDSVGARGRRRTRRAPPRHATPRSREQARYRRYSLAVGGSVMLATRCWPTDLRSCLLMRAVNAIQAFLARFDLAIHRVRVPEDAPIDVLRLLLDRLPCSSGPGFQLVQVGANDGRSNDPVYRYVTDRQWSAPPDRADPEGVRNACRRPTRGSPTCGWRTAPSPRRMAR